MKQIKFLLKPAEAADALIPACPRICREVKNWQLGTGNWQLLWNPRDPWNPR